MKTIKYNNGDAPITRGEILDNAEENDGIVCIEFPVDWYGVTYDVLNCAVEDIVEDGHLLQDLVYVPIRIDENDELVVRVRILDLSEYAEPFDID